MDDARLEPLLRDILDAACCGIVVVDDSGSIVETNRETERIFGYPRHELLGHSVEGLLPERFRTGHRHDRSALSATPVHVAMAGRRVSGLHKDGRELTLEIGLTPLRMGDAAGFVASILDVTDRALAEEREQTTRVVLETILEHLTDVVYCHDVESTGYRFRMANEAFTRATGVARGDVLGRRIEEVIPEPSLSLVRAKYDDAVRTGRTVAWEETTQYPTGVKHGHVSVTPIFDTAGTCTMLVGTVHDVTQHVEAEAALRESERRFQEIADNVQDVFFVFAVESSEVLYVNRAFETIFGRDRDTLVGTPGGWLPFVHADDRERVEQALATATRHEGHTALDFRILRADESIRSMRAVTWPVRDDGGRIVRLVGVAQDVTDLLDTQQQLLQAQKMEAVGRLAGGVAHDFNNLLTAITGYGELLQEELPAGSPARADLDEILTAGARAARLTRQLLAFSRQQIVQPRVVDLANVVEQIEKLLRRVIGEDIDLATSNTSESCRVRSDPTQLEQVLMNLAVNARDAMPQGGHLTIEIADADLDEEYAAAHPGVQPGPYVKLAMSDTGVGMTEQVQARIFDPFFTTKAAGKGTGLGLATVLGIVQQLDGHISVYSEVGNGTTFQIYLPRVSDAVAPLHEVAAPAAARGTETILLAEDEAGVRTLAERALSRRGYTVLSAQSGQDALQRCRDHAGAIDLLVTDMVMPRMSGTELARRVMALRPTVKVLYVSGYPDQAVVRHGNLPPDVAYLAKPFGGGALARKVREVLG